MALINKIREKTGLVVGIVAFGLILFIVGGDIMGPNSIIMGSKSQDVGVIAGRSISLQEFNQQVEDLKINFQLRNQRSATEAELETIRQQAWDLLIAKIAFQREYNELGMGFTEAELIDMVQGDNIHQEIRQIFANPQTGQFDREQLKSFLATLDKYPAETQKQWNDFENSLGPGRLRVKYENLLISTEYVTKEEAKREYEAQNAKAEVKYLYIPFFAISDSSVTVTDGQLEDYLNRNKSRYKVEDGASIEYVSFPVMASSQDSAFYKSEMEKLALEFKSVQDDSAFARVNSDGESAALVVNRGELPASLAANVASLSKGDVIGPLVENGSYKVYKVSDIITDSIASVKASHILFKPAGESDADKAAALESARKVLKQIRQGASFEEMAMIHGTDGTRTRGGDLGWFSEGRMVKEFENAVFRFNGTGLLPEPVKTDYGYHLIKVTEPKTRQKYKIFAIERSITPSDETTDAAFRKADQFAGNSGSAEAFRANVQKDSTLVLSKAANIAKGARSINELNNTREMVRWIYNEADINDVSKVFDLQDRYVVAVLTGKTEAGIASLASVRDDIMPRVKNEIKGQQILEKLKDLNGTLEEIAQKYGANANVYTSADVTPGATSLPNVGFAPITVGKIFGMKQGEKSGPIVDENGIVMVEVQQINTANEIADYTTYKEQLAQRRKSRSQYSIAEAIKEFANIKDDRNKYY